MGVDEMCKAFKKSIPVLVTSLVLMGNIFLPSFGKPVRYYTEPAGEPDAVLNVSVPEDPLDDHAALSLSQGLSPNRQTSINGDQL
jgi:hypothetical protein